MALTNFQVAHGTGWLDTAQARGLYIPTGAYAPVTLIKIKPLVPRNLVEISVSVFQAIASYHTHIRSADMRSVKTASMLTLARTLHVKIRNTHFQAHS